MQVESYCHLRWYERQGEDGDVVFLAVLLRGEGYLVGGLGGDCGGAVKAEEFAGSICCLHDAVGEECESVAGFELQACGFVLHVDGEA